MSKQYSNIPLPENFGTFKKANNYELRLFKKNCTLRIAENILFYFFNLVFFGTAFYILFSKQTFNKTTFIVSILLLNLLLLKSIRYFKDIFYTIKITKFLKNKDVNFIYVKYHKEISIPFSFAKNIQIKNESGVIYDKYFCVSYLNLQEEKIDSTIKLALIEKDKESNDYVVLHMNDIDNFYDAKN